LENLVEDVSISEAIALLAHSKIAQTGKWLPRVARRLEFLHAIDRIMFAPLDPDTYGVYTPKHSRKYPLLRDTIRLNPIAFNGLPKQDRLAAVSLTLAHEGLHAVGEFKYMYDELLARQVEVFYFRELSGSGVVNVLTGKRARLGSSFSDYGEMSQYLSRDQLVDYTLDVSEEYREERYVDSEWILANLENWGGLKNRWARTKRFYVVTLLPDWSEDHSGLPILRILESIESKGEWDKMINRIKSEFGSLRPLQLCFEELSVERRQANRVGVLQNKWKTPLTEVDAILSHPPRNRP
jgi:hypothetical protein